MEASETILALLADRAAEATICPSEVARSLATMASGKSSAGGVAQHDAGGSCRS
ncbi:DUF3253 domain-containing protein [Sphingomonas sp. SUN019]|uniref:DUF3253 domain-containing protein n=1 Tax=Sphingomonas sp. SUN019 TaxID=2937788 RepID=UPI002868CCF7|nr:DUF3253 domain-containing protein [Sphingomonas sp. SUN019]